MKTFQIVAVLLAASMVAMAGPYRYSSKFEVGQGNSRSSSHLGRVGGLRSCGGPGKVVEWRVEGCTGEGTCQLPGDGQARESELEFIPSQNIDAIGVRFIVIIDGETSTVYDAPISDSSVQGGETYIVHGAGGASEELKGKTITTQYILYHVDNNDVEVCAEADFQIV